MNNYPQDSKECLPIGRTSATERDAITSEKFFFWLTPDVIVNPYDIMSVGQVNQPGQQESRTFGVVTSLEHRTDARGHLDNYVSSNFGQIDEEPNTTRMGTTVASASVLSNSENVYMPVPTDHTVCFAKPHEIRQALGMDTIAPENAIPAGLIQLTNGDSTAVYIDRLYVLGPEGAHVNMTGISGLATKTSYMMFLSQSIQQSAPDPQQVATIFLNVKHADLLQIDIPDPTLSKEQKALWEQIGLDPRPFDNVHYLLPRSKYGKEPNSFSPIPPKHTVYAYDLAGTTDKLRLLFSSAADASGTIEGLCHEIAERIEEGDREFINMGWDELYAFLQDKQVKGWGNFKAPSVRMFCRHLRRIYKTGQSGIFTGSRSRNEKLLSDEIANIQGGSTYVIDIARLKDDEQALVLGDILQTIMEGKDNSEQRTVGTPFPDKVIIGFDELNKHAPVGRESPITTQILEVAERGRGLGVVLFGAEQFMSGVHERVIGNCATKIIGRSGSSEVNKPSYSELGSQEVRSSATRLAKGELLISHPHYRHPVKVTFPRPAYQQPKG